MVRAMAERPKHIRRALDGLWTHLYASRNTLAFGDFQQVTGYTARLERRIEQLEYELAIARGPSLWRRIRQRLGRRRLEVVR